ADHVDVAGDVAGILRNVVRGGGGEAEMKGARGENRLMKGGTPGENVEIVDLRVVASDVGLNVDHPEDLAEIVARQIGINHLYRPARHEAPDLLQNPSPHIDGG